MENWSQKKSCLNFVLYKAIVTAAFFISSVNYSYAFSSFSISGPTKSGVESPQTSGCLGCHRVSTVSSGALSITNAGPLSANSTTTTLNRTGTSVNSRTWTAFNNSDVTSSGLFPVSGLTAGENRYMYCMISADNSTPFPFLSHRCGASVVVVQQPPVNQSPGEISFDKTEYYVFEGDQIDVPLVRSGGSDGEVTVVINIRGVSATGGSDFIRAEGNPTDFSLRRRWIDGEVLDRTNGGLKTVNIQTLTDSDSWEGSESFVLELVDVSNGSLGAITTTTVYIDDDYYSTPLTPGSISFERPSYNVKEGEVIEVPMVRSGGSSGEVTVDISIRGITATAGADFRRAEGDALDFGVRRRWIDGEVQDRTTGGLKTVNIQAVADELAGEGVETFVLEMIDVSGGFFGNITQTTVSIEDVVTQSGCIYPGGDATQWGWDESARRACPPQSQVVVVNPPTNNCVYPGGDTNKWGWDNVANRSCAPLDGTTQPSPSPQPTDNCVYPGGDTSKWGWDNVATRSCAPLDVTTQPSPSPQPASNCVYPGGDTNKWGWDNVATRSCAPLGATTQPSPSPQPVSSCIYPGGDTSKWGWDNVLQISCRPL